MSVGAQMLSDLCSPGEGAACSPLRVASVGAHRGWGCCMRGQAGCPEGPNHSVQGVGAPQPLQDLWGSTLLPSEPAHLQCSFSETPSPSETSPRSQASTSSALSQATHHVGKAHLPILLLGDRAVEGRGHPRGCCRLKGSRKQLVGPRGSLSLGAKANLVLAASWAGHGAESHRNGGPTAGKQGTSLLKKCGARRGVGAGRHGDNLQDQNRQKWSEAQPHSLGHHSTRNHSQNPKPKPKTHPPTDTTEPRVRGGVPANRAEDTPGRKHNLPTGTGSPRGPRPARVLRAVALLRDAAKYDY